MRTRSNPASSSASADRADPPVHHVGGRDDVAAGLGLDDRLPLQDLDGLVVRDVAVADHAVMAVRGERVERHVAQHAEIRAAAVFSAATARQTRLSGLSASLPSGSLSARVTAGNTATVGMPSSAASPAASTSAGDRQPERRRASTGPALAAVLVVHKDRPDQVARGQHALGDELARPGIAAVAAQAGLRIGGERRQE